MRIIFSDGSQKGIKDEGIKTVEEDAVKLVVKMNDGAVFRFPWVNLRECKTGGTEEKNKNKE